MSRRPRTAGVRADSGAGLLALVVLVAAWAIGSTAVAVLGIGLAAVAIAARAWALAASRLLAVERLPASVPPVEGGQLRLGIAVRGPARLCSRLELRETVGPLGEVSVAVERGGRAELVVDDIPRGRYRLGPGRLLARGGCRRRRALPARRARRPR